MNNLEEKIEGEQTISATKKVKEYLGGMLDSANSRLYGSFQERGALNITQFPKIQGSMLIRMGLIYPLVSKGLEESGFPTDVTSEIFGTEMNWHTYAAGYLAYLTEVQLGLSKYLIEYVAKGIQKVKECFA